MERGVKCRLETLCSWVFPPEAARSFRFESGLLFCLCAKRVPTTLERYWADRKKQQEQGWEEDVLCGQRVLKQNANRGCIIIIKQMNRIKKWCENELLPHCGDYTIYSMYPVTQNAFTWLCRSTLTYNKSGEGIRITPMIWSLKNFKCAYWNFWRFI